MKISSSISQDSSKPAGKEEKNPLSNYVFILTETSDSDGEVSISAYSLRNGLTYIGTSQPCGS